MVPKAGKLVDKTWDPGLVSPGWAEELPTWPTTEQNHCFEANLLGYCSTYPAHQNTRFLSTAGWRGRVGRKDGPRMSRVHLPLMCCRERTTNGQKLLHHGKPKHRGAAPPQWASAQRSHSTMVSPSREEVMPQLHMFLSELPPLTGTGHSRTTAECCKHPQKPTPLGKHLPKTCGPRP